MDGFFVIGTGKRFAAPDFEQDALMGLTVLIYDHDAESHMVSTRKTITGMHTDPLFRIAYVGKKIPNDVIDMDFEMTAMSSIGN